MWYFSNEIQHIILAVEFGWHCALRLPLPERDWHDSISIPCRGWVNCRHGDTALTDVTSRQPDNEVWWWCVGRSRGVVVWCDNEMWWWCVERRRGVVVWCDNEVWWWCVGRRRGVVVWCDNEVWWWCVHSKQIYAYNTHKTTPIELYISR